MPIDKERCYTTGGRNDKAQKLIFVKNEINRGKTAEFDAREAAVEEARRIHGEKKSMAQGTRPSITRRRTSNDLFPDQREFEDSGAHKRPSKSTPEESSRSKLEGRDPESSRTGARVSEHEYRYRDAVNMSHYALSDRGSQVHRVRYFEAYRVPPFPHHREGYSIHPNAYALQPHDISQYVNDRPPVLRSQSSQSIARSRPSIDATNAEYDSYYGPIPQPPSQEYGSSASHSHREAQYIYYSISCKDYCKEPRVPCVPHILEPPIQQCARHHDIAVSSTGHNRRLQSSIQRENRRRFSNAAVAPGPLSQKDQILQVPQDETHRYDTRSRPEGLRTTVQSNSSFLSVNMPSPTRGKVSSSPRVTADHSQLYSASEMKEVVRKMAEIDLASIHPHKSAHRQVRLANITKAPREPVSLSQFAGEDVEHCNEDNSMSPKSKIWHAGAEPQFLPVTKPRDIQGNIDINNMSFRVQRMLDGSVSKLKGMSGDPFRGRSISAAERVGDTRWIEYEPGDYPVRDAVEGNGRAQLLAMEEIPNRMQAILRSGKAEDVGLDVDIGLLGIVLHIDVNSKLLAIRN